MQIIKVPGINSSGKTAGCEKAGNEILAALKDIHSNESGRIIDTKLLDLEEIHLDNRNLELTNKLIQENALEAYETKPKLIFLGGDHSISFSLVKTFMDYCQNEGKNPCLIVFDAHPNLMQHNTQGFPIDKEWLKAVIDCGFPKGNILIVGLRNSNLEEIKFISENRIRTISCNNFISNIEDTCEIIMEFADRKELYLSLDISVVDPAYAPGVSFPEPGGLTSRQLIYIIQRMNKMKNLKAVDIVGINPLIDKDNLTVKLGAKILSELI